MFAAKSPAASDNKERVGRALLRRGLPFFIFFSKSTTVAEQAFEPRFQRCRPTEGPILKSHFGDGHHITWGRAVAIIACGLICPRATVKNDDGRSRRFVVSWAAWCRRPVQTSDNHVRLLPSPRWARQTRGSACRSTQPSFSLAAPRRPM